MSAPTNVGGNGLDSELKQPRLSKLAELRAESRRLRLELLNRTIDITFTIAGFHSERPRDKHLQLTATRIAQKGYERALAMLESAPPPEEELMEFRRRLDELRHAIANGDSPPAAPPVRPALP